jgi:hypothetical protein
MMTDTDIAVIRDIFQDILEDFQENLDLLHSYSKSFQSLTWGLQAQADEYFFNLTKELRQNRDLIEALFTAFQGLRTNICFLQEVLYEPTQKIEKNL